jgi:hypothetical protein
MLQPDAASKNQDWTKQNASSALIRRNNSSAISFRCDCVTLPLEVSSKSARGDFLSSARELNAVIVAKNARQKAKVVFFHDSLVGSHQLANTNAMQMHQIVP